MRTVCATRYLTPLREGGSLPAIVEADDDGLYVLKFRGAGQGAKALIAELVAGEIARALGLPVLMVVGLRLGCVHQARATQAAIRADGCGFTGWIANPVDIDMARYGDNLAILERVLGMPPLRVMARG